jgi:hypothetical protein
MHSCSPSAPSGWVFSPRSRAKARLVLEAATGWEERHAPLLHRLVDHPDTPRGGGLAGPLRSRELPRGARVRATCRLPRGAAQRPGLRRRRVVHARRGVAASACVARGGPKLPVPPVPPRARRRGTPRARRPQRARQRAAPHVLRMSGEATPGEAGLTARLRHL